MPGLYLVHTSHYSRLEKTDYTACHPKKTTTYILHVVSITTHTHVRLKSMGNKKREEKTEKKRNEKTKRGSKERKGKNTILAGPRN